MSSTLSAVALANRGWHCLAFRRPLPQAPPAAPPLCPKRRAMGLPTKRCTM